MSKQSNRRNKNQGHKAKKVSPPPAPNPPPVQAPLPSTQVLSGQALSKERADALRALHAFLGDCPETFTAEEWRVVHAVLDPDRHAHVTQKRGAYKEFAKSARAKACFPGTTTDVALRLYEETLSKPHVSAVIQTIRAQEALDVLEHRHLVRQAAHAVLGLSAILYDEDFARRDPRGAAALAKEVVSAHRALVDLDDLKVPSRKVELEVSQQQEVSEEPEDDIPEVLSKIMEDLKTRRAEETP